MSTAVSADATVARNGPVALDLRLGQHLSVEEDIAVILQYQLNPKPYPRNLATLEVEFRKPPLAMQGEPAAHAPGKPRPGVFELEVS